jgi:hypothetical protein
MIMLEVNLKKKVTHLHCLNKLYSDSFPFYTKTARYKSGVPLILIKDIILEGDTINIYIKNQVCKEIIVWNLRF